MTPEDAQASPNFTWPVNRRVDVAEFAAWATACGTEPATAFARFLDAAPNATAHRWKK